MHKSLLNTYDIHADSLTASNINFLGTNITNLTTTSITEGTNLYYTDARVESNTDVKDSKAITDQILSIGSGSIISTAERSTITSNQTNIALNTLGLNNHITNTSNPHNTTALQLGITDIGSGVIIANTERDKIATNTTHTTLTNNPHNTTALQLGITDLGSTAVITA